MDLPAANNPPALAPDKLSRRCDPARLGFQTTDDLADLSAFIAQPRAASSLEFAAGMRRQGYNLFVMGPPGAGKHEMVRRFFAARARAQIGGARALCRSALTRV